MTHRGLASSFAVVTGHEDPAKAGSRINWANLATATDTLIFLMGLQNLPEIVNRLVEHGRAVDAPAAVVKDGTRPRQQDGGRHLERHRWPGTRGRTDSAGDFPGRRGGEAQRHRPLVRQPSALRQTHPRHQVRHPGKHVSKMLAERGALPVGDCRRSSSNPFRRTKNSKQAVLRLTEFQWVVFTSVNGVAAFFDQLRALKLDSRALSGRKIAAIGTATGKALEAKGIDADYVPDVFTTRGLLAGFQRRNIAGQRFLLPRADLANLELVEGLAGPRSPRAADCRLPDRARRPGDPPGQELLSSNRLDAITFTSSSTVTNLMSAFNDDIAPLRRVKIACIGPITAETARKAGLAPDVVAKEHTIAGLVEALDELFRNEAVQ